jgi:hypothetical protein
MQRKAKIGEKAEFIIYGSSGNRVGNFRVF